MQQSSLEVIFLMIIPVFKMRLITGYVCLNGKFFFVSVLFLIFAADLEKK